MPLFRRRSDSDLVAQIVEELSKAQNNLAATPMASAAPYASSTAGQPTGAGGQGLLQTPGIESTPLPRMSDAFGSQLGPAAPFLPAPLDPVDPETGRALPRVWEYPVAWNLNLNQRATPWGILRALADQCDVVHRCIELRISQIVKMNPSFTVADATITEIMDEENVSHAKAARIGRDRYSEEIARLTAFWENPYPEQGRPFSEWITEFLWQHYTFDGVPVYPRYNLARDVIGFEIIDAPTIKVLLDNRGALPQPPNPAFQQILWGFSRGEYQSSPDTDGEFYSNPGRSNQFLKDQLAYYVRNRRTWSPYGFSAVEEAIPAATLYLERQAWLKSEYVDGSMPSTFMTTDAEEFDVKKLAEFERIFNDKLMGQTAERRRVKVLPKGFTPVPMPTVEERFKPEYDELLIKRIGAIFGVSPSQLGVTPRSGLGGQGEHNGEMDQTMLTSQRPIETFLIEVVNSLSERFLGASKAVTFTLTDNSTSENEETRAKAYEIETKSAQKTINDVRGDLGLPLYDMVEADEPFVMTANGPVFLKGLLSVDTTGETIGQKKESHDDTVGQSESGSAPVGDSVEPEVQEGAEGQKESAQGGEGEGQSSLRQSESAKTVLAELTAFSTFVKSRQKRGSWRDFTFDTISAGDAAALNADGAAIVKGDTFEPPSGVKSAARRALDWIEAGKAGSGFTPVGRKRASDLSRGAGVSLETLKRMKAYFDRHQSDKDADGFNSGEDGYPSPGRVAWDAWGGDAGYSWAKRLVAASEKSLDSDNDNPLDPYSSF